MKFFLAIESFLETKSMTYSKISSRMPYSVLSSATAIGPKSRVHTPFAVTRYLRLDPCPSNSNYVIDIHLGHALQDVSGPRHTLLVYTPNQKYLRSAGISGHP